MLTDSDMKFIDSMKFTTKKEVYSMRMGKVNHGVVKHQVLLPNMCTSTDSPFYYFIECCLFRAVTLMASPFYKRGKGVHTDYCVHSDMYNER